jgi:hypothetical protein
MPGTSPVSSTLPDTFTGIRLSTSPHASLPTGPTRLCEIAQRFAHSVLTMVRLDPAKASDNDWSMVQVATAFLNSVADCLDKASDWPDAQLQAESEHSHLATSAIARLYKRTHPLSAPYKGAQGIDIYMPWETREGSEG